MDPDDFIGFESSSANNSNGDLGGLESKNFEIDSHSRLSYTKKDHFYSENGGNSVGEDARVLDMELKDGIYTQTPVLYERAVLFGSSALEQAEQDTVAVRDAMLTCGASNSLLIGESPITGVKRARSCDVEKQPSVQVVFSSLTRDSKRKLVELMQQWSRWQAHNQFSSSRPGDESLEDGEETYFPALHVGTEKSNTVTFWMDSQARREVDKDKASLEADVPFYDRGCTLGSNSVDGSGDREGIAILEASRCFNCGSYSHSLKECSKPRDNEAINNARKMHNSSRRNPTDRARVRYYQKTHGKFDDLCAGVLGSATRECLGIGENDPPPWLHRMREIGYPPGYLDEDADVDQPSGITIFANETNQEFEDGELPERSDPEPPRKKMSVAFPGINAPVPDNADSRRWGIPFTGSGSNSSRSHVHQSNHSSDHHRGNHIQDNGTPERDRRLSSSYPGYSPRYHPYNHNLSSRSPNFGRSLFEQGWGHPCPSPRSPYPYTPALLSPRDHYHYQSYDHRSSEGSFRWEPDSSSFNRYDYHSHNHHNCK
ncbi:uncharacterized protein LOC122007197 isoform X1 [Zingiber officinale]|uniref:uncharacterized protein LOC122007197 isoform X1 n=1 Tax=Zingiber officinale TaxID=94328 RepID=UPI001C4CD18E|nr:uncharacterized protein LOC122007197 isoform X1 [Zingiber officinale]